MATKTKKESGLLGATGGLGLVRFCSTSTTTGDHYCQPGGYGLDRCWESDQWTREECQDAVDRIGELCPGEADQLKRDIKKSCCMDNLDLVGASRDAAPKYCEDPGGGSGGDGSGGSGSGGSNNPSTSTCGEGDAEKEAWWESLPRGGMCLLFPSTCEAVEPQAGNTVYCCTNGSYCNQPAPGGGTGDGTNGGDPPPGWVPGFFPSGYTKGQYATFMALSSLGALAASWLLWGLLFGGDDDDDEKGGTTINVVSGGQPSAKKKQDGSKKSSSKKSKKGSSKKKKKSESTK